MSTSISQLNARDVMTRRADTIRANETIHTAIEIMVNLGLSALPVVNQHRECVGVLTKTDIIKLTGRLDQEEVRDKDSDPAALIFGVGLEEITAANVEDVMSKHILQVNEEDPVTVVADKMLVHQIHHVPVCNLRNQVVGVVSSLDLVKVIRDSVTA